jgi:hypothetical protein
MGDISNGNVMACGPSLLLVLQSETSREITSIPRVQKPRLVREVSSVVERIDPLSGTNRSNIRSELSKNQRGQCVRGWYEQFEK